MKNIFGVKYPLQSDIIKDKLKNTVLIKYGVENICQSKEIQNKIKQTNLNKYGTEYVFQAETVKDKIKKTCLERFGVDSPFKSKEIREKGKQTMLKKYGFENPSQSPEISRKKRETMIKNGNNSQLETYFETKLNELNIKYIVEHKTNKYPFKVDFYLIEKDLYIEINGFWTHGGHWFNKSNKCDIIKLNTWIEKSKNSEFYKNAINTWVNLDVKKRNKAKENNLNYIVLWNKNDIDYWFKLNCPIGKDWIKEYFWEGI